MRNRNCYVRAALLLMLVGLLDRSMLAQTPDPSQRGPFATIGEEYNLGDTAFTPTGFPAAVELRAVVFHPTDLTQGPYPLIIFLHGRHSTCFQGGSSFLEWPCSAGHSPIPSFRGYDYAGDLIASNGYIVVSISANGINAQDNNTSDLGAGARAQLIQKHLDLWKQFNTTGASPFGTKFVGAVDLNRIGTMGHSRGGEGVLRHFLFNQAQPSPYPIKVIVPIAPTNFSRWQVNDGVAVTQLLSYCDGDVNNIQGLHAYDDGRYKMPNGGFQQYVAVMGGNHNFFNANWTPGSGFPSSDDWTSTSDPFCGTVAGNGRLTAAQQRSVASAYLPAFFRSEVGGESAMKPLIDGSAGLPPSVSSFNLNVSFHAANPQRRDLNRLLTASDLTTNFLGGVSSQTGLTPHDLCGGESPQPQHCLSNQATTRQPHTAPSSNSTLRGLSQLRTGWGASGAAYANEIPSGPNRDISGFQFFQFRASVNFTDTRNPGGQAQDFSVRFTDEAGASQSLRAGQFSNALFFPPGTNGAVPKVWQNTVRIPISSLTGISTNRVARVELVFDQKATGALLISDLHFYGNAPPPTPNFSLSATPASRTVVAGSSASYSVSVTPSGGFSDTVNLSASSLPSGATATFNPASIGGGSGSSALTIATSSTTPVGSFVVTITGASGAITHSTNVTLTVTAAAGTVFFDDFETDQGWVRNPNGSDTATTGLWERGNPEPTNSNGPKQLGTTISGVNDLVTGRLAGSSAGVNDVDGGITSIRSPQIALTGGTSFTLTFAYYFAHGSNSSSADFFRVRIVSGSTTTTVLQELGSAVNDDGVWTTASLNLNAFAGQTIRILIEAADASGASLVEAAVDDVKIVRQ